MEIHGPSAASAMSANRGWSASAPRLLGGREEGFLRVVAPAVVRQHAPVREQHARRMRGIRHPRLFLAELERALIPTGRLRERETARGIVAGTLRVLGGGVLHAERDCLPEVTGHLDTATRRQPARCLDGLPGPAVQQRAAIGRDGGVHRVARQHVREVVAVDVAEVLHQQTRSQALLQRVEHRRRRHFAHRGEQTDRDVAAEHRGRLQHVAATTESAGRDGGRPTRARPMGRSLRACARDRRRHRRPPVPRRARGAARAGRTGCRR